MLCLQFIREIKRHSSRALYWRRGTIYAPPLAHFPTFAAGSPNHSADWHVEGTTVSLGRGAHTVRVLLYAYTAAASMTGSIDISIRPLTETAIPHEKD